MNCPNRAVVCTKIAIIIDRGCVSGVYSDSSKVEVEIIDLDDCGRQADTDRAEQRAQEVAATYVEVG